MSWAAEQIRKQDATISRQRDMWSELLAMADAKNIKGFWLRYATHLEERARENGVLSNERALLIRVMKETAGAE